MEGMTALRAPTNRVLEALDASATNSALRFYRITVRNP